MAAQRQPAEQQPPVAAAQEPHFLPLVSAGETDHDSSDPETTKNAIQTNDSDDEEEESYWRHGDPDHMKRDDLYDANMDDENEAWVYKHRRGGVEEAVQIAQKPNAGGPATTKLEQAVLLKPRNSDAVLSCPCCFEIVCMDCQQHERYLNQYRAMFVMNINVNWQRELVYCEQQKGLVEKPTAATVQTNHVPSEQDNVQVYYSVHCNSCQTQVAALDMKEEIYHFFGCLSSA